ncbi:MAG: DUF2065 domain-containing protein [Parvibaculales bacterium]
MLQYLLLGIGLVFVVEGTLYALFPDALKRMIAQMGDMKPEMLRTGGVMALAFGVLLVWLSQL